MISHNFVKKASLKTSAWSGGTTTELAIFPENALYKNRDFIWRLSSAVIELEESDFTKLDKYNRILMVLTGKLLISHKVQYDKMLDTYEQDSFYGGWETKSKGQVTDFNLMMAEGVSGAVEIVRMAKTAFPMFVIKNDCEYVTTAVYALQNSVLSFADKKYNMSAGDFYYCTKKTTCNTEYEITLDAENNQLPPAVLVRIQS